MMDKTITQETPPAPPSEQIFFTTHTQNSNFKKHKISFTAKPPPKRSQALFNQPFVHAFMPA
ncbi:hypothetical protein ACGTN6_03375 [Halomonas sp. THAF12]|uniref:hypothetical protein n=1 Tax=Halomonas sp. B23F22_10 TaxID=3459515 RepID=UPI00373F9133